MLYDGLQLFEGSVIKNPTVASGTEYPGNATVGELFCRSDLGELHVYTGNGWVSTGAGNGNGGNSPTSTDELSEGEVNLYYTEARSRASISVVGSGGTYNPSTGVLTLVGGGGGGGSSDPLSGNEPDSASYTYNVDGKVESMSEMYAGVEKVTTFTYNTVGKVEQIVATYAGMTRTETYTYNTDGKVESMTAVLS